MHERPRSGPCRAARSSGQSPAAPAALNATGRCDTGIRRAAGRTCSRQIRPSRYIALRPPSVQAAGRRPAPPSLRVAPRLARSGCVARGAPTSVALTGHGEHGGWPMPWPRWVASWPGLRCTSAPAVTGTCLRLVLGGNRVPQATLHAVPRGAWRGCCIGLGIDGRLRLGEMEAQRQMRWNDVSRASPAGQRVEPGTARCGPAMEG
jgi:hypothetical protein